MILLSIFLVIFLSSCDAISNFGFGGSNVQSGTGISISFIEAPKSGATMDEGEEFSVVLHIENGIPSDSGVSGTICLRDSTTDTYGGVTSDDCRSLSMRSADITDKGIFPYSEDVRFPVSGFYSYRNLERELSYDNQIYADFAYELETKAVGTICVARPQSTSKAIPSGCSDDQSLTLSQPSGVPIAVSSVVAKSRSGQDEVRLRFDISMKNSKSGHVVAPGTLLSPSSEQYPEISFEGSVNNMPIACTGVRNGFVEFSQSRNEKVIKCTASINLQQDYIQVPVILRLRYGYVDTIPGPKLKLRKEGDVGLA